MTQQDLTLYISNSCPYCTKVVNYMENNGITITTKDVSEEFNKEYLIEHGGKGQVPCLFIDGKPLYESSDIIAWLKENN
ncbi:MAG: hypothetical protein S4CHLAM20_15060 [Chlamydiia bacterium]|nr:hypothetical protein [Chlamydiia bacterium]